MRVSFALETQRLCSTRLALTWVPALCGRYVLPQPPYLPDLKNAEDKRYVMCDNKKTLCDIFKMELKYKDLEAIPNKDEERHFAGF